MAPKGKKGENEQPAPIIIKRIKKVAGGHHGGAWKVAYADFVTAMMAFFLLLWLLNVTTEDQKNAISNYFDPSHPQISDSVSGAGGVMGGLTMTVDGAQVSNVQPIAQPQMPDTTTRGALQGQTEGDDTDIDNVRDLATEQLEKSLRKKEDERFKSAADNLKAEIAKSADLKEMQKNLMVDITPEGMRIQIVDDKGRSMFPSGSAQMYPFMRELLLKVSGVIKPLPNQVSVRGHTDSNKYKDPSRYDNWNLSADRAQSSRRVLVDGGLPEARVENVMGRADREHLDIKNPANEKNRRISIILLREKFDPKNAAKEQPKKRPVVGGITIVDDTKPAAQAGTGPTGNAPAPALKSEQAPKALPVTPSTTTSTIKRQPQVLYFGEDGKPQDTAPLYKGPVQDPIENKPPTIKTPVFKLEGDAHKTDKQGPHTEKTAPADKKAMTFNEVEKMTPPTHPSAPAKLPPVEEPARKLPVAPSEPGHIQVGPAAAGSKKVLEF
ncbi:MAG: motility protein MotB [Proteobacteria bacterium]|nr:motility protein MotB [Pseudomonadota bacterium]